MASPDPAAASPSERSWAVDWLSSVADGSLTMSQRKLSSIDQRGGGLRAIRPLAKAFGVHLVQLTDDRGDVLVAASKHPFKVIA